MALLAKINPSLNPPVQVGTVEVHAPGLKGVMPEPGRDVWDGAPISEIGHVAYYHAHNKFAALSNDAADFLRCRFV